MFIQTPVVDSFWINLFWTGEIGGSFMKRRWDHSRLLHKGDEIMSKTVAMISGITLFALIGVVGCGIREPSSSTNATTHTLSKTTAPNNDNKTISVVAQLSTIQMSNKLDGWGQIDVGNNLKIISTRNGGTLWKSVTTVTNTTDLQFGHSGLAWYATRTGGSSPRARVHFTKDWGKHWAVSNPLQLPTGRSDRLQLSFAPGQKNGWLAVTAGAMNSSHTLQLWRTTDGGAYWSLISKVSPSDFLLGFQNYLNGWAEWSHAGSPLAVEFTSPKELKTLSKNLSKLDSSPALYHTTDGGDTWKPQFLPVPKQLIEHAGLAFLSNMAWFGHDGLMVVSFSSARLPYQKWGLYSTTDGGVHWSLHLVNGLSNNYGRVEHQVTFDLANPNDLWETVTELSQSSSYAGYQTNSTILYHSLGVGQKWSLVGETPVPFEVVQFVSPSIGFGLTSKNGTLYRTMDGGRSWTIVG